MSDSRTFRPFSTPNKGIRVLSATTALILIGVLGSIAVPSSASSESWSPLGAGLNTPISALTTDPSGNLYAGVTSSGVTKWDGSIWTNLGATIFESAPQALAADSQGNIYAGGNWEDDPSERLLMWNGSAWDLISDTNFSDVKSMAVDANDDLYLGWLNTLQVANPIKRVAKWDSSAQTFVALGAGIRDGDVYAVATHSTFMYAGGNFTDAGFTTVNNIAQWNDSTSTWSALAGSNPITGTVRSLATDASGKVYVSSEKSGGWNIAMWDPSGGGSWTNLGDSDGTIADMVVDASNNLYVGGTFSSVGNGVSAVNIAMWNGSTWAAVDITDISAPGSWGITALAADPAGIYAGGTGFTVGASANVARLESATPTPLTPGDFVTEWTTSSPSETITLPVYSGGTYNFTVNWGDGSAPEVITSASAPVTHTYATAGAYTVTITGTLNGWNFTTVPASKDLLTDVLQWGDVQLGNLGGYFQGASNLDISATDAPDLTLTTDLSYMFHSAASLVAPDLSGWDTSSVTKFSYMFYGTTSLTTPNISTWDTGAVTDFSYMFASATTSLFNGNIGYWDVSSGTTHKSMFYKAQSFNGSIDFWDLSATTDVSYMFQYATSFNQDLSTWQFCATTSSKYTNFSTYANSTWTSASPTKLPTFSTGCSPATFTNTLPTSRLVIDYVTPNGQNRSYTWVGSPDTPAGNLPSPAKASMTFTGWFSRQSLINGTTASTVGTAGSDEVFAGLIPSELAQVLATLP